jgi:hypothetical protein
VEPNSIIEEFGTPTRVGVCGERLWSSAEVGRGGDGEQVRRAGGQRVGDVGTLVRMEVRPVTTWWLG